MVTSLLINLGIALGLFAIILGLAHWNARRKDRLGIARPKVFRSSLPRWNLTASLELAPGRILARGTKMGLMDRATVETGRGDPAATLLAMATASKGDIALEIDEDSVCLRSPSEEIVAPRSALRNVHCASGVRSRRTMGYAASLLYVCLRIEGPGSKGIGDAAVGVFAFTQGIRGPREGHPHSYGKAVADAEQLANDIASALVIPYHDNESRGLFAPLASLLHR